MNNEDIVRDFIQRRMPSPPATGTVALVALHNLVAERDALAVSIGFWEAEVKRLRESLEKIVVAEDGYGDEKRIARAALAKETP